MSGPNDIPSISVCCPVPALDWEVVRDGCCRDAHHIRFIEMDDGHRELSCISACL